MPEKITIDVIILTKNREFELTQAISAVINNTHLPKKIILINSSHLTRNTFDKISQLILSKKIILKYKELPAQVSIAQARNAGLNLSVSDVAVFLDDDEIVPSNWLKQLTVLIRKFPKSPIINGSKTALYPHNYWNRVWMEILSDEVKTIHRKYLVSSNLAILKSFRIANKIQFDDAQGYKTCEDLYLGHQLEKIGQAVLFVPSWKLKHAFRLNGREFTRQWLQYGFDTCLFTIKYKLNNSLYIANWPILLKLFLASTNWYPKNFAYWPYLWVGNLVRNFSFSLGFFIGFLRILTTRAIEKVWGEISKG